MPHDDVTQQFTCFRLKLFCCRKHNLKLFMSNKSDTRPFALVCKKLWTPSFLSLNLAPYILPQMRYNVHIVATLGTWNTNQITPTYLRRSNCTMWYTQINFCLRIASLNGHSLLQSQGVDSSHNVRSNVSVRKGFMWVISIHSIQKKEALFIGKFYFTHFLARFTPFFFTLQDLHIYHSNILKYT